MVLDTTPSEIADPLDVEVCSQVGRLLVDTYSKPAALHGRDLAWNVECVRRQGVLKIALDAAHADGNKRYGWQGDIRGQVTYDMLRDIVKKVGGELLERAYVSRTTGARSKNAVDRG